MSSEDVPDLGGARPVRPDVDRTQVGRYRLAYELASGGMATVYMACVGGPGGFDKVVALKRIHRHLASEPRYVDMFLDEARLASRIDHPNVVSVIDFGEQDGDYFLVMEFLLGVPLSRVIATLARRDEPAPSRWPAIASHLVAQACEGLHAAHELRDARGELLGVVHRDVSPQNLFVGFDGALRVVDFGIAQAAGKLHQTSTGEMKGKLAYMAPEQVKGLEVDRRTDVWALGVVLWEMLTFRRLFKKSNEVDAMYHVLEGEVPPPSLQDPTLPEPLDATVLHALTRPLDERLPDARTMARELTRTWGRELTYPVDAAEVSQLLHELFPGEEERQRNLVELARFRPGEVPQVAVHPDEGSFSGIDRVPREETATRLDGPPRRSRGQLATIALVLVAVALGAVVGVWASLRGSSAEEVTAASVTPADAPDAPPSEPAPAATEIEPPATPEPVEDDAEAPPDDEPADEAEPAPDEPEPTPDEPEPTRARPRPRSRPRPPAPREELPPEAPPPSGPGRLVVVVPGGWANVYGAGGRFLGATPVNREMPAGRHRLQLRFNGQPPPVTVEVDVPAGGTGRVSRRPPE